MRGFFNPPYLFFGDKNKMIKKVVVATILLSVFFVAPSLLYLCSMRTIRLQFLLIPTVVIIAIVVAAIFVSLAYAILSG